MVTLNSWRSSMFFLLGIYVQANGTTPINFLRVKDSESLRHDIEESDIWYPTRTQALGYHHAVLVRPSLLTALPRSAHSVFRPMGRVGAINLNQGV